MQIVLKLATLSTRFLKAHIREMGGNPIQGSTRVLFCTPREMVSMS
jgi:hypothetical protein